MPRLPVRRSLQMTPMFDRRSRLVGWLHNDINIFDTRMHWVGFLRNGHVFGTRAHWLGSFRDMTFQDRRGNALAWLRGINRGRERHHRHPQRRPSRQLQRPRRHQRHLQSRQRLRADGRA
ncbi:4-fold beta flower protein [Parvibaculum sp.]|uniref:4-fold beta flower protein n=1 Tax=Parvibaculum sp. TaxID=2024848 RepID=UPI00391DF30D